MVESVEMEEAGGGVAEKNNFARKLGSTDKKTREKGLSSLVLWLSCQKDVGEDELKKIWKGLFYCLWHSDKAKVQGDLINKFAGILDTRDSKTSLAFFEVFLTTMRREWGGIDRLRLDKFYRLLRQFLVRVFALLQKSKWDEELIGKYLDALVERTLLAKDQYPALGVNLHFVDIYLAELRKFQPLSAGTLRLMLQPCYATLAGAPDKSLLKRVKESVFVPLLEEARAFVTTVQAGGEVDENSFGPHVVSLPLGARIFELASLESTPQANRKVLYDIHAEYTKLDKLVASAGIDLSALKIGGASSNDVEMGEVRASGPTRQSARQARKRATMDASVDVVEAENAPPKKKKMKKVLEVPTPNEDLVLPLNVPEPAVTDVVSVKTKKSTKTKATKEVKSKKPKVLPASRVEETRDGTGAEKVNSDVVEKVVQEEKKKGKKKASHVTETAEVTVASGKSKSKKKGSKDRVVEGKGSSVPAVDTGGRVEIPEQSLVGVPNGFDGEQAQSGGAKSPAGDFSGLRDADSSEIVVNVDDSVVSNLQDKFASIAAETEQEALRSNGSFGEASPTESTHGKKKRKRAKAVEVIELSDCGSPLPLTPVLGKSNGALDPTPLTTPGSNSTKKKKVKFVLKNNIVWKPNNPLPPQSMRTPPSATPRGSALKKGVPPGPIRVTPTRKVGSGSKRRSPSQILSITKQAKPARSPKSLSKGGPRFARRVRKSPQPGSL